MLSHPLHSFTTPNHRFQQHRKIGSKISSTNLEQRWIKPNNLTGSIRNIPDPEKHLSADSISDGPPKVRLKRTWMLNFFCGLRRLTVNWWLWEFVSMGLSALCLCAIGLLLACYNGQALPKEWPLGFTLNTYIAILSAFFKYTLAIPVDTAMGQLKWIWFRSAPKPLMDFEKFDEASRGPWGSVVLFIHTRGRRLASLGASVTLLSLALDPFFQQVVSYPQRPSLQGVSTITRSTKFQTERSVFQSNGSFEIDGDNLMTSIIKDWMMFGGVNNQLSPYCPTDDCEWSPFQTLGICSRCADISEELQFGCQDELGDWRPGRETQPQNSTLYPPTNSCGYFFNITGPYPMLATGYATNSSNSAPNSTDALLWRLFRLQKPEYVHNSRPYWNGSLRFQNVSFPIVDFVTVSSANAMAAYNNQTPIAHECVLQWCVQTISASYSQGTYREKVLATVENNTFPETPIITFVNAEGVTCDNVVTNITIETDGQEFFVDNFTAFQTIIEFEPFMPIYITVDNSSSPLQVRFYDDPHDQPLGTRTTTMSSSAWLNPNNITKYVQDMATSLTNAVRTYPNSTEPVPGSGALETYIRVRWAWLTLPLILVCLAFIFFVLTIYKSSECSDIKIWKNSALAILLNGLTDDAKRAIGPPGELLQIREGAREINVRLDNV